MEEIKTIILKEIEDRVEVVSGLTQTRQSAINQLIRCEQKLIVATENLSRLQNELAAIENGLNAAGPYARSKDYQEINQAPFKPDYQQ